MGSEALIGAGIATLIGLVVAALFEATRKRIAKGGPLEEVKEALAELREASERRGEELRTVFALARIELGALKATLEALQGNCDGNVEAALAEIDEAQKAYDKFMEGRIGE